MANESLGRLNQTNHQPNSQPTPKANQQPSLGESNPEWPDPKTLSSPPTPDTNNPNSDNDLALTDGYPPTQLSRNDGVIEGVASIAIPQPGFLAGDARVKRVKKTGRVAGSGEGPREDSGRNQPLPLSSADRVAALDDNDLMLRVGAGDDAAFDVLVHKYRRPIVSFMSRMVRNQGQAEELAQEVFLRVYRSRATYAAEAKFTTWMYRIATNLVLNNARDTKQERMAPKVNLDEPDPQTGIMPDVADRGLSAEEGIMRRERLAAIKQQVMSLPEKQRMAVVMHKYQDMDYRHIAEVLKLSESATKSLLFRAYSTLREKLKEFV